MHFNSLMSSASLGLAVLLLGSSSVLAQSPSLGAADSFAVLGATTVTSAGVSTITGDLGLSPGTAITGFPPGTVTGTIHAGDAVALQAQADLTLAYDLLAGAVSTTLLTGTDLGGLTLMPGVYTFAASAPLNGTLTLDALGDPNAVFVFQIGSTLLAALNSSVLLVNGAHPDNVFWQVGSSATLAAGTSFTGNILALASITLSANSSVSGRALARNGAVTMDSANVMLASVTGCGAVASVTDSSLGCGPTIPVLVCTTPVIGSLITARISGGVSARPGMLLASPAGTAVVAFQGCPLIFSSSTRMISIFVTDGVGDATVMQTPLSASLCGTAWALQAVMPSFPAASVSNTLLCTVGI